MNTKKNMIKIFGASIVLILLFSTCSAAPLSTTTTGKTDTDKGDASPSRGYTHTVLAEQASATWCGYCPAVIGYLDQIYTSGLYDFQYVALVNDMNSYASARISELGVTGFPTVIFDGGYTRLIGDYGSTGPYINALNNCGGRTVAQINLNLDVTWLGNAQLKVTLNATNNDGTAYSGHVHAYVTEINSRWAASGHQYHYAMIGNYALNQNINIPAGTSVVNSVVWDGVAQGYGDITRSNIMVIASIFRSGTSYSDNTTASYVRDDIPPEWQNQGQSKTAILRGENIGLYAQGKDNLALNSAVLATNETGTWQNITGSYGSPMNMGGIANQWAWSNFTWQNPAIPQERTIGWRIYYIDSIGNINATDIMSFTILSNPVITDYTSTAAYTGAGFTFNASVVDDDGVNSVYAEYWYDGGGHTNLTMNPTGVNGFYEQTITIPPTAIALHYIISAKDTKNYWSNTGEKTLPIIDIINPEYQYQGESSATIQPGGSISLYAQGRDNIGLDAAWLATNETGAWLNFSGEGWWNGAWGYSKQIVIHHAQVPVDLTDFTALITCTSPDFINHAQPDGDDFVFVDATNTTKYNHEIESYTSTTGELVAWVKIPHLSSTQDTVLYLYYGNPASTNQQNVAGTWDSNYIMVDHLTGATSADLKDSSSNHWDITSTSGNPSYNQIGKAGRCVDFDGVDDSLQTNLFRLPTDSSYTAGAWVYVDGNAGTKRYLFEGVSTNLAISLLVWTNESFKNYAKASGGTAASYSTTTINVANPQWYYVSTRADATSDRLDIFINGVNEANVSISGTINPETLGLSIGTSQLAPNSWMNGKIDEIRISNVLRSNNWIKTEYNNIVTPSTFATVGEEQIQGGGWKYGSPMKDINAASNIWTWTNFTWQNPSIPDGTRVGWRIYYFDAAKNIVGTDIMSFLVTTQSQITPPTQATDITAWHTDARDMYKGIGGYTGKYPGQPYTYQSTSTETGNDLYFTFYWGDTTNAVVGPVSGSASATHIYGLYGTYSITVTVKHGPSGTESSASDARQVKMFKAGDTNNDGSVNWRDIDPFVTAMSGKAAYYGTYSTGYYYTGDCNFDLFVNWRDIDPFVALMGT